MAIAINLIAVLILIATTAVFGVMALLVGPSPLGMDFLVAEILSVIAALLLLFNVERI